MKNKIVTVFIKQQSFFISKILYGCVIWINLSIKKMKLVKKVQNNADHLHIPVSHSQLYHPTELQLHSSD